MIHSIFLRLAGVLTGIGLVTLPVAVSAQAPANQASATPPSPPAVAASPLAAPSYRIGKGDVIEVAVVGRDDYKARVQVQEDGAIQLPLINSVPVENQTALQVRDQISSRLQAGGYFVNPAISVTVVNYASRYVTVLGQVATPGVVAIDRAYRLSEVIARAGGVSNPAINTITVTSPNGQSRDYQLNAIATGGPEADPLIGEGDKVFVAVVKTFYIYGQVNAPGSYPVEPGMTVRMALAKAGGLTPLGSDRKVKLVRGEQEERVKLTETLVAGDVLVIGERFF